MDIMIHVENGKVTNVKPCAELDWVRAKEAERKGILHYKYHNASQTYATPGECGWRYEKNPPDVVKLAVALTK